MRIDSEVGRIVVRSREATIDGRDQHQRAEDLAAEVSALRSEVQRLRRQLIDVGVRLYPHLDAHARVLR